jgi:hypothetical protein
MCANSTRVIFFDSGVDVNLAPLRVSKNELESLNESFTVEIRVVHITPQSDYQIFDAFKRGNISEVFDMIDAHKGVNAIDEWGTTILMSATIKGNLDVVAALLNARLPKVDVNTAKSV